MAKTPKNSAELHALIWDRLNVPVSNRRAGHINIYRVGETWRAMSTLQTADPAFRDNVIAVSIQLSEQHDLID